MRYYTVKEIEESLPAPRIIVDFYQENRWVVLILDNGIRIKFRNY